MTERVLLPLRQRHTQHQRDADGQRNGYFKGADAVGKGQRIVALYKIVGAVVDASAGHQREDAGQQEEEFPYGFYVSDLADEFKEFANSILPYDVEMTKKIDIEKY